MLHEIKTVKPDTKGRITLGELAKDVSHFKVFVDESDRLILEPYVEIPAREKWLFDNKQALHQLRKGLKQAAEGQIKLKGSFAQYLDEDET